MNILLLGPPGAGKGTQGAILAQRLGLPKFATGDLLRDAVAAGTPLGRKARSVMESGALVGDDIILGVVREELEKPAAAGGVVFDGVVRTIPQAEGVATLLDGPRRAGEGAVTWDGRDATGRLQKGEYGPWMIHAFRVLARLKSLRGTALDPFGRTDERRTERKLVADYLAMIDRRIAGLKAAQIPLLAWIFLGETLTVQKWAGMLVAGLGVLVVQVKLQ